MDLDVLFNRVLFILPPCVSCLFAVMVNSDNEKYYFEPTVVLSSTFEMEGG